MHVASQVQPSALDFSVAIILSGLLSSYDKTCIAEAFAVFICDRPAMVQHQWSLFSVVIHLSFAVMVIPPVSSLSFNFTSFRDDDKSFHLEGDASFNRTVINLTRYPMQYATGRVVYSEPLLLWDADTRNLTDFTTHFSFIIDSVNESSYADGLAFFLSPYGSTFPTYSRGGFLGLFSNSSLDNTTVKTVAVEFDTFSNDWDPKGDHLGIDVNSIISNKTVPWNSRVREGRWANAWVNYDATTFNLSAFVTYGADRLSNGSTSLSLTVDLRDFLPEMVAVGFSATTGNLTETHTLLSWSFNSTLQSPKENRGHKKLVGIAVAAVVVVVVALGGLLWFLLWGKKATARTVRDEGDTGSFVRAEDGADSDDTIDDEFEKEGRPKRIPYQELVRTTRNFSEEGKLGEGGFGSVYKGNLDGFDVAIKRISKDSKQGRQEYVSEVKIINRLRHRNLVRLIGWCHARGEFLLVYEFMPNGNLNSHLYSSENPLGWPARHKIALGLASALFYLHEECEPYVVHRDVKPSNVMLDSAFNAKLGDFGLARLVDHDFGLRTTNLAGTLPYMAPEYLHHGTASKESDVYSFGIVALEIACGRRPMEAMVLVEWVWEFHGMGAVLEAADKRLNGNFKEEQMERLMVVGLWCAHPDHSLRPSIKQAINVLNSETPLPKLPPRRPRPVYRHPSDDMAAAATSSNFVTAASSSTSAASASSSANAASSSSGMNPPTAPYYTNSSNISISPTSTYQKIHERMLHKFDM
ncbi:hypothetical protein B296_00032727 [Ensete ventricosum]|uniref:non-specific serine/threonine protein kinase n=1 Tax=Ensete ventricosum TaxID=4639 RepID=A0A426XR21_ENSVE|nr:hypothetical protein B296_00032727 [Ensete ventricosum]